MPIYEYAGFKPATVAPQSVSIGLFLTLVPLIARRNGGHASALICDLQFTLIFVPLLVLSSLRDEGVTQSLIILQVALSASMTILYASSSIGICAQSGAYAPEKSSLRLLDIVVVSALCILLIRLLPFALNVIKMVPFSEVYVQRQVANAQRFPSDVEYTISWITYFFAPYLLAKGVVNSSKLWFLFGILLSTLIYSITAAKLALFLAPTIYIIDWVLRHRINILVLMNTTLSLVVLLLIIVETEASLIVWAKAILLIRVVTAPAWAHLQFYEYFVETFNSYTFWSHVGFLNGLFHEYPHGGRTLGQVIATFAGSDGASFNAGFWASDGLAAFGLIGLLVITVVVSAFLIMLNLTTRRSDIRFGALLGIGFTYSFLNVPLATSILSGGGLFLLLSLMLSRLTFRKG